MMKQAIINFCTKNWPSYIGIVSSKINFEENKKQSDKITIAIIDPQFSVISTTLTYVNNILYNCICVPLNNIENILINERFNTTGSILELIAQGEILDTKNTTLLDLIKEQASYLYDKENPFVKEEYKKSIKQLQRIKKGFGKNLKPYQKFFLINEMVCSISEAELTRNSKWIHGGHNKSVFLYNNSRVFVTELMHLTRRAYQNLDSDVFLELETYLNYYLENSEPYHIRKKSVRSNIYAIELKYENFSLTDFITGVLPKLRSNELVNSHLQYFYLSPKTTFFNIYRGEVTLIFSRNKSLPRSQAHLLLTKLSEHILEKKVTVSLLSTDYLIENSLNKGLFKNFAPIGTSISVLIENQTNKTGSFDNERLFFIGIILNCNVLKSLDLEIEDIIKLNFYLSIRYMFKPIEQNGIESAEIMSIMRQKKYELYTQYNADNRETIEALVNKGLRYTNAEPVKEYDEIIKQIEIYLQSYNNDFASVELDNQTTAYVLKENYKINDTGKALVFTLLFEQIMTVLNLDAQQICLCSFVISESILTKQQVKKSTFNTQSSVTQH